MSMDVPYNASGIIQSMYNYYSSSSALAEMQAVMIISIVVGIFFVIIAIWAMVSIISMSHSLKDIRDIMQKQYIISGPTLHNSQIGTDNNVKPEE